MSIGSGLGKPDAHCTTRIINKSSSLIRTRSTSYVGLFNRHRSVATIALVELSHSKKETIQVHSHTQLTETRASSPPGSAWRSAPSSAASPEPAGRSAGPSESY